MDKIKKQIQEEYLKGKREQEQEDIKKILKDLKLLSTALIWKNYDQIKEIFKNIEQKWKNLDKNGENSVTSERVRTTTEGGKTDSIPSSKMQEMLSEAENG